MINDSVAGPDQGTKTLQVVSGSKIKRACLRLF